LHSCRNAPERSPKTSISLSYATWNAYGSSIRKAFARIKFLALQAKDTEYEWIRKLTKEMRQELENIRLKLTECALGSPEEE
jgi:hypothetical protein